MSLATPNAAERSASQPTRSRRILLVDCDQFFVQCARIADPDGAGRERLLLVGGSAEGRGVVTSASYETRAYGVRSGMPTARALRLCPQARTVPVPRALCAEKSRAIRAVLGRFSPVVEPASIDEAYVDMTGTELIYREPLRDTALHMQRAVLDETDIVVSIGGAPTKLVAKLAVGRAKPGGVRVVADGEVLAFMRGFALADIPGVGPVFATKLRELGLVGVEDALRRDENTLEQWLGHGRGEWLYRKIHGIDESEVRAGRAARSMSREETFANDIDDDDALETELLALAVRLGADVRASRLRARTITVKLRDADFTTRTAARSVTQGLEADRAIYPIARELLTRLRRRRRAPARLIGIAATNFVEADASQLSFLDTGDAIETERDRSLARAGDQARERFGPNALRPGRLL